MKDQNKEDYAQMAKLMRKSSNDEPFVRLTEEMLRSPAWQALDRDGYRMLNRLMIENFWHHLIKNGRFAVSYAEFKKAGIHQDNIKPTRDRLRALGLIDFKHEGNSILYRLTFMPSLHPSQLPTDEWKKVLHIPKKKAAKKRVRKPRHPGLKLVVNRDSDT